MNEYYKAGDVSLTADLVGVRRTDSQHTAEALTLEIAKLVLEWLAVDVQLTPFTSQHSLTVRFGPPRAAVHLEAGRHVVVSPQLQCRQLQLV